MDPPSSDPAPLPADAVIAGKLRVVRLLGVGGMGAVYEVEHRLTKHRGALKVLHRRAASQPTTVTRFLREASAAARIGNAHIAETYDAGTLESGEPYLLMELLQGDTLEAIFETRGPLAPSELADLVGQACEGVLAAHEAGIIHRDLKPENLFVTRRDGAPFVKILDFGISKFDAERTGALGVTVEGTVMGTPYYMPPEQVRGETSIDARADVYALGVILYEGASGVRPFEAQTLAHLAVLIHQGKPKPLGERCPSLPPAFCEIVHSAMASDREARFASARALGVALASMRSATSPHVVVRPSEHPHPRLSTTTGGTTHPPTSDGLAETVASDPPPRPPTRRANAWPIAAGTALIAAAMGIGVVLVQARPKVEPTSVARIEVDATTADTDALHSAFEARVTAAPSVTGPSAVSSSLLIAPRAAPSLTVAPAAPVSTAKSHIDRRRLEGENPY